MSQFKDITGQKFGRLTALYRLHNIEGRTKWLCICDCGNFAEVMTYSLSTGHAKSCGCYQNDRLIESLATHYKCHTKLYKVWSSMKKRCYNKKCNSYKNYGARGIAVCDEWKHNFQTFHDWAMDNNYQEGLSIDRINVDGNYEPNNCRWTDRTTQNRNRTNNISYTIDSETHCLKEWCEILNLNYHTVHSRVNILNWPIEKALGSEDTND